MGLAKLVGGKLRRAWIEGTGGRTEENGGTLGSTGCLNLVGNLFLLNMAVRT